MNIIKRLEQYLERENVRYEVLTHRETFTAPELAEVLHVPGMGTAKVVVVKADERFVMMVLPANWKVDFKRIREILGTRRVRLASESEVERLFPDCEVGAMPPFGNLYGLDVYVD